MRLKKLNAAKDREMDKLKKDAKRKEVVYKRKHEELKVMQA